MHSIKLQCEKMFNTVDFRKYLLNADSYLLIFLQFVDVARNEEKFNTPDLEPRHGSVTVVWNCLVLVEIPTGV